MSPPSGEHAVVRLGRRLASLATEENALAELPYLDHADEPRHGDHRNSKLPRDGGVFKDYGV